jgi:hypothetical protein
MVKITDAAQKIAASFFMIEMKSKGREKFSLCLTTHHVMKAYWGSGGTAPRIL